MEALPFVPEPAAVSRWLATLGSGNVKSQGRMLYHVLKTLNATVLEEDRRLLVWEELRKTVFAISELLAQEFLRSPAGWCGAARNTAKLSAFLHYELALGYGKAPSGALAGQRAMASLGQVVLRIIQLGEPVSSKVWRRLYDLFLQGEQQDWLEKPVADPLAKRNVTPAEQFRCILAFTILSPMHSGPETLTNMLAWLQRREGVTVRLTSSVATWCFDPDRPCGPWRTRTGSEQREGLRYLSITLTEERPTNLSDVDWCRLRHHLGKPVDGAYPLERRVDELWCGWDAAVAELQRHRENGRAMAWLDVPKFELTLPDAPEDPESVVRRGKIHRRVNALLKQRQGEPLALLETDVSLWDGDLLILKLLDGHLLAAVVRWSQPGQYGTRGLFGLDLFIGRITAVKAIVPRSGPCNGIQIRGDTDDVLLLPPFKLKPGMEVLIGTGEAIIARLLEWTETFCAYRLVH